MGHKRRRQAPSPLEMLSIFDAYSKGMTMPDIAERTKYSVSTLLRWHKEFGHEVCVYDHVVAAARFRGQDLSFDAYFPPAKGKAASVPDKHDYLAGYFKLQREIAERNCPAEPLRRPAHLH